MHDWHFGTKSGDWVSMAVVSDGSYGIPGGLVFSFPVTIDANTREWKIVQGLEFNDFAKQKIDITTKVFLIEKEFKLFYPLKELTAERDDALEVSK
jgi:malate/lactate dehydrogenase